MTAPQKVEPYTLDEMNDDHHEWSLATDAQRSKAFNNLLGIVTADALTDAYCAHILRKIRAERDGDKS